MTVRELIEELSKHNQDSTVLISDPEVNESEGYNYLSISKVESFAEDMQEHAPPIILFSGKCMMNG